jgi:catechol 2,3-dioxygenase-like lactoylglutathione lyase family enzyme
MQPIHARFSGVELYFDDLQKAKNFYEETLGLAISDEQTGHHAKFDSGAGFICLEQKGAESYPSKDKAVLFFEVADIKGAVTAIGQEKLVYSASTWAVLHDVVLLETDESCTGRSSTQANRRRDRRGRIF